MMALVRRYARFILFYVTLAAVSGLLSTRLAFAEALLIGFDIAAVVFMAALVIKMRDGRPETMRQRAAENEPNHATLLLMAGAVVMVINVAVWFEISAGSVDARRLGLTAATLLVAWLFGNFLFALHYAHAYYLERGGNDRGGLEFPGDDRPDYWDFAYFAFVLGMTFQVSDVAISDKRLRRVALIHGIIAFLFNICVIALTVSLVGDALKR